MTNQLSERESVSGLRMSHVAAILICTGAFLAFGGIAIFQYLGFLKGWEMLPVSIVFGLLLIVTGIVLAFKALE